MAAAPTALGRTWSAMVLTCLMVSAREVPAGGVHPIGGGREELLRLLPAWFCPFLPEL